MDKYARIPNLFGMDCGYCVAVLAAKIWVGGMPCGIFYFVYAILRF